MEFATNTFDADGRAALALAVSLLQVLREQGVLKGEQAREVVERAGKLLPQGAGRLDEEARTLVSRVPQSTR